MKNKLYSYLINNNISIEKDVFEYGFEYFYSYIIYLLVIIPISVFNHFTVEIIIFIILYIPIRKNIGGFHLKNKYHLKNYFLHATSLTFHNLKNDLAYLNNKTFIAPFFDWQEKLIKSLEKCI